MYYFLKDARSTKKKCVVYLVDYLEVDERGRYKVDRVGFVEATIVTQGPDKMKVLLVGKNLVENDDTIL